MRYKILTSEIDATSMDKYTYLKDIEKVPIQHLENKRIKGFYCKLKRVYVLNKWKWF